MEVEVRFRRDQFVRFLERSPVGIKVMIRVRFRCEVKVRARRGLCLAPYKRRSWKQLYMYIVRYMSVYC